MNNKCEAEIMKLMRGKFQRFHIYDIFHDFVSWAALSIRHSIEPFNADNIESHMQEFCKKYNKQERCTMVEMFSLLTEAMELAVRFGEYTDILSRIFQGLEIHSKNAGQFFTPWNVAYCSAKMAYRPEDMRRKIEETGYITAYEPTVGGGTMILALAQVMREAGFHPQKELLIYATDIDYRCACMAYIHTSLYCLPAVIQHGNELSQEIFGRWFTPVYVFDLWCWKDRTLRNREKINAKSDKDTDTRGTETSDSGTERRAGDNKRTDSAAIEQLALFDM